MNIGNIVTKSKIEVENFNICKDLECIDETLPTIIVGWKFTKELLGNDISILHKTINKKLFWTFDSKERKSEFEIDLENFKDNCFNIYGENIPYVYLDLLYNSKKINYRVIKKILSLKNPVTYFSENNMVYIYGDNILFGIDLNVIEYFDNKKEKIIEKIKKINSTTLVDHTIFNKCKDLIYKLKNKNRYITYIYGNGIER